MKIAVCLPQVPFVRGGAEILADGLVEQLQERGHEATLVTVPYRWYPNPRVLTDAMIWRLVELDESHGRPIDMVIATKFPSYAVRHPNKVVWLVHQFRQAYELDGTEYAQFGAGAGRPLDTAGGPPPRPQDARRGAPAVRDLAERGNRLHDSTGMEAEVLLPPPQRLAYRC